MKIAVIDIGTNTFNLIIASLVNHRLKLHHVEKEFVFLGKGGINKNIIQSDAFERGLNTLNRFSAICDEHGVKDITAIATSAVRNAKNGNLFTQAVFDQTGITIQVISGDEEATHIFNGARAALRFGKQPVLLMDIGGGSTEFIIGNQDEILWKQSFEVGAARLYERFHQEDPMPESDIRKIEDYLLELLQPMLTAAKKHQVHTLIGSSGAFTSMAKIEAARNNKLDALIKTSKFTFDLEQFEPITKEILKMPLEKRILIPGLIKERAPMIVVGIILVKFVLENLQINTFKLARYALKEGVAFGQLTQK